GRGHRRRPADTSAVLRLPASDRGVHQDLGPEVAHDCLRTAEGPRRARPTTARLAVAGRRVARAAPGVEGTTPMTVLLGIDIGTSASKGALVDRDGTLLAQATREHATSQPRPGW